ncbi:plasmid recombination protein [Burkholderia vietnamiensis]|uniref:plasmid recombination protein n=1 Tax=Burkholderia cepacia complex TaxID=87882 RepID=UPI0020B3DD8A|nr:MULTISPECIES: plasmid recombination protein [Burkholderia cepacia complex]MDN8115484.1 plasmid recombination protein [Burkholderia vietnamiensis]
MAYKNKNEVKPMYACLRTKKIRNRYHLAGAMRHNLRLRKQKNIDSSRSESNQILVNDFGIDCTSGAEFTAKLNEYYQKLGIKEKKNNVLAFEYFAIASPGFFEGKSIEDIGKWAADQVKFMRKEFGDQLKFGVLHLDEKTPHIHFFVTTEQKSMKRYKNQKGEFFKETWSLSSRHINPEFLADLQTRFAENNSKWGLVRGQKGSKAKHQEAGDYEYTIQKVQQILESSPAYEEKFRELICGIDFTWKERMSEDMLKKKFSECVLPLIKDIKHEADIYKQFSMLNFQKLQMKFFKETKAVVLEREEIKEERKEIEARREVYAIAINEKFGDAGLVFRLQDQLLKKDEELATERKKNAELRSRLRQRFEKFLEIAKNFLGEPPKPKIS